MKHLKIFEDYFGKEYVNKKDLEFFEELLDYLDNENWKYIKNEFDGKREKTVESFKKSIPFSYNSGKEGQKTYYKDLEISKTFFEPKNILDAVKEPFYEVTYEDQILELPQEKVKGIFDKLYHEHSKKEIGHARNRRKGVEKERDNDLKELLGKQAKKYNL